jgi:hypothetical protein
MYIRSAESAVTEHAGADPHWFCHWARSPLAVRTTAVESGTAPLQTCCVPGFATHVRTVLVTVAGFLESLEIATVTDCGENDATMVCAPRSTVILHTGPCGQRLSLQRPNDEPVME